MFWTAYTYWQKLYIEFIQIKFTLFRQKTGPGIGKHTEITGAYFTFNPWLAKLPLNELGDFESTPPVKHANGGRLVCYPVSFIYAIFWITGIVLCFTIASSLQFMIFVECTFYILNSVEDVLDPSVGSAQGSLLLIRIKFNPRMDKLSYGY